MPRRSVAILLPLLVIASAAACGGGTRKVQSKVTLNQDYDFETAETFTVVPLAPPDGLGQGGPEFAARYDVAFANALRNELASRGLREVEIGNDPDLAFTFAYGGVERVTPSYFSEHQVISIPSVEGRLVVTALDGTDLETIAWQNDVAFDQDGEWGAIEEAEANAPRDVRSLLATFPIPREE